METHLVGKLLEQHCHNLLTSLLQTYYNRIWLTSFLNSVVTTFVNKFATRLLRRHFVDKLLEQHCHNLEMCNLTLSRLPGASEYHDGK